MAIIRLTGPPEEWPDPIEDTCLNCGQPSMTASVSGLCVNCELDRAGDDGEGDE